MSVIAAVALTAVLLAAIGIHGLIATSVAERTREMGIRFALGATAAHALRSMALPGIMLAVLGTVIGTMLARAVSGLLRHFLWGVSATDPTTYAAVVGFVLVIAAGASVIPALRIMRIDPAKTLRME